MLRAPKHLLPKAENWMSAREAILAAKELDTEGDTVEALMKKFFVNSGKSRKRTICLFASKYPRSRSRFPPKEAKRRIYEDDHEFSLVMPTAMIQVSTSSVIRSS